MPMNIGFHALPLSAAVFAIFFSSCGARRPAKAIYPRTGTSQSGIASWYGDPYHGRQTASGEVFDMEQMTAAHRAWAFGTIVNVRNLDNGRTVLVKINDRGPFVRGRIIDLSRGAAREAGMLDAGLAKVKLTVVSAPAHPPPPARGR